MPGSMTKRTMCGVGGGNNEDDVSGPWVDNKEDNTSGPATTTRRTICCIWQQSQGGRYARANDKEDGVLGKQL